MSMGTQDTILILGGSGFVGSHLANRLTDMGLQVRIPVRRREQARHLLINPRIEVRELRELTVENLQFQLQDCCAAINLVGILNEHKAGDFQRAHVDTTRHLTQACQQAGVQRLLQMSALNANGNETHSQYLRTKGEAEDLAHNASGLQVTSFRPSVIFGPDDSFFNRFAGLLKWMPFAMPLACPDARFAPVYVGDVASAFVHCLKDDSTIGAQLDLCGPKDYSLRELVQYTAQQLGLRRSIIGLPDFAARLQGRILQLFPIKMFTLDNYWSLQIDSLCQENAFARLGITPRSLESTVPGYLAEKNARGYLQTYRNLARRP